MITKLFEKLKLSSVKDLTYDDVIKFIKMYGEIVDYFIDKYTKENKIMLEKYNI